MKTKMLLCLLGVLIIFDRSSSQPYGPLNISFGMNANYNSILNDYTYSGEQTSGNDPLYLGTGNTGTHHRAFFQWTLPQNFPTGSVVSQVQIQFSFGVNSGSPSQSFKIAGIVYDFTGIIDASILFNDVDNASMFVFRDLPSSSPYSEIFSTSSPIVGWIQQHLTDGKIILALADSADLTNGSNECNVEHAYLTIWTTPQTVTADQIFSSGGRVQNSQQTSQIGHWENTAFMNYGVPHPFTFDAFSTQTLRGDNTNLWFNSVTESLEKYQIWSGQPDVINHRDFYIFPSLSTVTSQFNVTNNATLQSQAVDGGNPTGSADFMDPWLVDNPDPNHGDSLRNEGMSAPLKTVSYATNNLGTSSSYKGVFLNQTVNSGTYYSVNMTPRPINGYLAFFSGWACSPSGSITFTNASNTPTSVVFNSSGATITANSTYYTVTKNATVPAGTYTVAGTLIVNSGAALTVTSGTTLKFPSGAGLVVNGTLSANGVKFTQSTSNGWTGISLNHDGSSITNCSISHASSPLTITNVNTATINTCVIDSSTFGNQAISVINSTPNIVSVQINGQSGSSNGVRYTTGRGGTLQETTIQNLGAGNGIVVQANTNPTISNCLIENNYYYGIILIGPTTGVPLISGNDFYANGTHGGTKQYFNLYFNTNSWGTVQSNYITGSSAGVCSYGGSFPTAGNNGQIGSNTITGNDYGLLCMGAGSQMGFGSYNPGKHQYNGTCNSISGNNIDDAFASGGAGVVAEYNWWGIYPPNASKIYIGAGSTVDYSNALTSQGGCPSGGGGDVIEQGGSSLITSLDSSGSASELYQRATNALLNKDYSTSSILSRSILRRNASVADKQQAMVRLLSVYLQSGDTTILSDLKSYMVGSDSLSQTAEEQLANAYAARGNTSKAVSLANDLITKNPGTEIEKRALLLLASLRAYDKSAESISAQALKDVKARFGSSLDQGLMAALTTASDVSSANFSSNKEAAQKAKGEAKVDNTNTAVTEYGIENYPNPFNPTTTIAYQLPKDGRVTIKIFDAIGREVTTLVDEFKPSGRYSVQFDASHFSSGIYFYSLRSGSFNVVKKMSLIK